MGTWLRRVRGALGMGLAWGVTGFLAGGVIELIHNVWPNPVGGAVDIWPAVLAYPGFFGGICFSAVLGIAARHRSFDELSLPRVALWGALGGVLTSQIPTAMVLVGLASPSLPLWQIALSLAVPFSLGGATAAAGTLWLARRGDDDERRLRPPSTTPA
jgi:hypothetical protein